MLSVLDAHKATLAQPSSRLPQQVAEHFAEDATLLYVPTAAGAQGRRAIEQFIKQAGAQSHMIEEEKLVSRIVGEQSVVEEVVVTLTHSDSIEWLLPGVRATKKRVVVPMVTVAAFDGAGRIASKRVYWDQASVLRQLAVLPRSLYCKANASEVQLPVLDAAIAAPLHGVRFEPNVLLRADGPAGAAAAAAAGGRPRPGPLAAVIPQGDEPAVRASPVRPRTDVFNTLPGAAAEPPAPRRAAPRSAVLGADADADADAAPPVTGARPSSRVLRAPGGGSSIVFGGDDAPLPHHLHHALDETGAGAAAPAAPQGTGRRTYGDTNRSQFSFGDDSTPVSPTLSQASSAAAKQLRQQPSSEAFDEQPLPRPLHTGRRMNPNSNHSQFSFGGADAADGAGDQAGGVRPLRPSPFDAPLSAVSSTSSMSFDEQPLPAARSGRRDPNALSEAPAHRPSSRVLRAPGGGSSISFG